MKCKDCNNEISASCNFCPRCGTNQKRCFLCGKRTNLIKTECCGQWICDDEHRYVLFSYEKNSCSRNHRRLTLCSHHYEERHSGKDWRTCKKCKEDFETEFYVYYGTNEFNFLKLKNPPSFELVKCADCKKPIERTTEAHTLTKDGTFCDICIIKYKMSH